MAIFNDLSNKTGSFYFGNLNPEYAASEKQLFWTHQYNDSLPWWNVPIKDIKVGAKPVGTESKYAIIDSGTSLIEMTDADLQKVLNTL